MKSSRIFSFPSLVIAALIALLCGCNQSSSSATVEPAPGTTVFDRLAGTWRSTDGNTFERWTRKKNNEFLSEVFSVEKADTLWKERARVYATAAGWIFENTVSDQNAGKSVPFTSTLLTSTSIRFSNPEHDFPTDIQYTVTDEKTVHAFIVGPGKGGTKDTIHFDYTRVE